MPQLYIITLLYIFTFTQPAKLQMQQQQRALLLLLLLFLLLLLLNFCLNSSKALLWPKAIMKLLLQSSSFDGTDGQASADECQDFLVSFLYDYVLSLLTLDKHIITGSGPRLKQTGKLSLL